MGGIIERHKEIAKRRHRKKKLKILKRKAAKATISEKAHIATKIRKLTPGAEVIIATLGLEERKLLQPLRLALLQKRREPFAGGVGRAGRGAGGSAGT